MAWSATIYWIVMRPLTASMATLALNSGLGCGASPTPAEKAAPTVGAPIQGRCSASKVDDWGSVQKSQTTSRAMDWIFRPSLIA